MTSLECKVNTGFVTPNRREIDCTFSKATNKLYNVGGANAARIVTLDDNVKVWRNSSSDLVGTIDRGGFLEISTQQDDVFYSCGCIFGQGEEGSAGIALIPEYLSSNELGTTAQRFGGVDLSIYSLDATSAQIFRNGSLVQTLPLTPRQTTTFTQTGNYVGNWKVVANGQILGHRREDNAGNGDSAEILKPSTDILGWASTAAYIAKESGSATPQSFQVYSHLGNYTTGTIATTYNIVNSADLPHNTAQDDYYDPNVNIRVQSSEALYGNSIGDSDGGDNTPLVPTDLLTTHHKIPQPTEYISITSLGPATVEVSDINGNLVQTVILTKANTDSQAPYAARIGTANNSTNQPLGYELVGSEPILVVYQPKGAGSFGSDDDEQNSWGYNKDDFGQESLPESLPSCNNARTTFANFQQFSFGFGVQNTSNQTINKWQYIFRGSNVQIDINQITNNNLLDYTEIDNGDGTYDLYFESNTPIAPFGNQGNFEWPGVNFGQQPQAQSREFNCE